MMTLYLRPSVQPLDSSLAAGNALYGINRIADETAFLLRNNGVTVSPNAPEASSEPTNAGNNGLYLALCAHTTPDNEEIRRTGSEVCYDPYSMRGRRAAEIVADDLRAVYPDPSRVQIFATTRLAEITTTGTPAVLVALAHCDSVADARWLRENTSLIARNLALSVCAYFGLSFAPCTR